MHRRHLLAAALAAPAAYLRWLGERRSAFLELAERGTYLAPRDVARLLDLPLPGVDELVGLLELVRLARESGCSHVVVDTAPTGHTLRLLALPATFRALVRLLDAYLLEKTLYELAYELQYRPDWVGVPLESVLADLDAAEDGP